MFSFQCCCLAAICLRKKKKSTVTLQNMWKSKSYGKEIIKQLTYSPASTRLLPAACFRVFCPVWFYKFHITFIYIFNTALSPMRLGAAYFPCLSTRRLSARPAVHIESAPELLKKIWTLSTDFNRLWIRLTKRRRIHFM